MTQQLVTSGKVIAALALLEGESDPADLFRYGPAEFSDGLTHYAGVLKSRFSRGKARELAELLHSWTEQSPALPIHEIHPGWVLEVVAEESPRVIGLICRYLPGSHVRYLLENLPRETRDRLPTLSESFGLPDSLMEQVKQFLASQFFQGTAPNPNDPFSCRHVPWMNSKDLRRVIRELGYADIRAAFAGVDAKAIQAFLTRFPIDEAKTIRRRIEDGLPVGELERQRAQEHIVSMNLSANKAEDIPFEIGLSVLAQAVLAEDPDWIEGVVVRLAPREGYILRRAVRESLGRRDTARSLVRQQLVLGLIRELADRGAIGTYWKGQAEEETTASQDDK